MGNGEIENFEDKIGKKLTEYLHKISILDKMCIFDWDNFFKSCPSRFFLVLSTILKMNMLIAQRDALSDNILRELLHWNLIHDSDKFPLLCPKHILQITRFSIDANASLII